MRTKLPTLALFLAGLALTASPSSAEVSRTLRLDYEPGASQTFTVENLAGTMRILLPRRVRRKRPDSLDAYELVLKAQPDVDSGMPTQVTQALVNLERSERGLQPVLVNPPNTSMTEQATVEPEYSLSAWKVPLSTMHP